MARTYDYYDFQKAKVNLYYALKDMGWNMFHFKEDESDSMTDYFSPASWSPAIAIKNGFTLCIDISDYDVRSYSGKEEFTYSYNNDCFVDNDKIKKLEAMTQANGATAGEEANAQSLIKKIKEQAEQNRGTAEKQKQLKYKYPEFMANPGKCKWHIEKDGKIYDKGTGIGKFCEIPHTWEYDIKKMEYTDSYKMVNEWDNENGGWKRVKRELPEETRKIINEFKSLILRFERVVNGMNTMGDGTKETEEAAQEQQGKIGYEKVIITESKTVTKPVEVIDRKTIQKDDILSFKNGHGGYWQVIDIWQNSKGINCYTYEILGSAKRGYQRLKNGKRYYQTEKHIVTGVENGNIKIHTMQTVTESTEVEKWVKIDKSQKPNNSKSEKVQKEKQEQQKTEENSSLISYEYTITADIDTRDDSPLWVLKIADKLSREEYIQVSEKLKTVKGFYSKFKHGFIFKYDPTEVLKGNNTVTEQPTQNKAEKTAENILDWSTSIITELGLNHDTYSNNEEYKNMIVEKLQKYNIKITADIITYLNDEGYNKFAEVLQDIVTEQEQKRKQETQQAEKIALLEKIENSINSLQNKIDSLSGDYKTNTYKRMQEQAGRESKIESWEIDIKLLEWVQQKLIDNEPITVLEKALIVGAFRDSIHSYYRQHEYYNKTVAEKRNSTSREIRFPQIDYSLPIDGWYNKEVPKKQAQLKKYGITNTQELIKAVEEYKIIYNSIDRYVNQKEKQIKKLSNEYKLRQKGDINFTPSKVVDQLIELSGIDNNSVVLEPSAGIGNIADKIKAITEQVEVCEQMNHFCELLKLKDHNIVGNDFLELDKYNYYDCIIMNPPFSAEQEHIKKAFDLLKVGGRIVAITSPSWTFTSDRKSQEFRQWFNDMGGEIVQELESGTFEMTQVRTQIIVIDKDINTMREAI